jgi:hypothetical protein
VSDAERRRLLAEYADAYVSQARRLGFSDDDLIEAVRQKPGQRMWPEHQRMWPEH